MGLFDRSKKNGGFMGLICCDEPSYLIWKWHPAGAQPNSNRENVIRWGSWFRVKAGEVAVFVYKQKNGIMQDFIEGPCFKVIKTANFPALASNVGLACKGGPPFQAEVYFINLVKIIQTEFDLVFTEVHDPCFLDFSVVGTVRGTINFRIGDYRAFIKLHRMDGISLNDFQWQIRDEVSRYVRNVVAKALLDRNISVAQIERKTMHITELVKEDLKQWLSDKFGVSVSGIDISMKYRCELVCNGGVGHYHEEEHIWVEQNSDGSYCAYHEYRSPMVGFFKHSFRFDPSISLDDFISQMYEALPYASSVLSKETATDFWRNMVSR